CAWCSSFVLYGAGDLRVLPSFPTRRSSDLDVVRNVHLRWPAAQFEIRNCAVQGPDAVPGVMRNLAELDEDPQIDVIVIELGEVRSEEHTSELQSRFDLVCRLLLEKKKTSHT